MRRNLPLRVLSLAAALAVAGCATARVVLVPPSDLSAPAPVTLVTGVNLFDGEKVLGPSDILFENGLVARVGPGGSISPPPGAEVVWGVGRTLLPGLIDAHVHIGLGQGEPPWAISLLDPPRAEEQLAAELYCGVTTILVAGHETDSEALSERISAGKVAGPRMLRTTQAFGAPDGHPAPTFKAGLPWPIGEIFAGRSMEAVRTPEEARERVRGQLAAFRSSFVKVMYDDLPAGAPRIDEKTLAAIVDEARAAGVRTVVHVGSPEEAIAAVDAGAALLMHTPWEAELTEAQVQHLAKAGVPLVTTVRVWSVAGAARRPLTDFTALEREAMQPGVAAAFLSGPPPGFTMRGLPLSMFELAGEWGRITAVNLRKLRAAGVPLLVGTDSGVPGTFHGAAVHRELAALVYGGFSPAEALRMATFDTGRFLVPDSGLGTLLPGAPADALLVEGDPLTDIRHTERIVGVWKRGRKVNRKPAAR